MTETEKIIELSICRRLTSLGCYVHKIEQTGYFHPGIKRMIKRTHPFSKRGFPDLFVCKPPMLTFLLEIKKPGGTLTDSQKETLPSIRRHGGLVFVVRSVEESVFVLSFLERMSPTLQALYQELPSEIRSTDLKNFSIHESSPIRDKYHTIR